MISSLGSGNSSPPEVDSTCAGCFCCWKSGLRGHVGEGNAVGKGNVVSEGNAVDSVTEVGPGAIGADPDDDADALYSVTNLGMVEVNQKGSSSPEVSP